MTTHTPGPWTIEKTTDGYGVRAPHWGYVAIHHSSGLPHWDEGQAANRLLIAAAPDLLDALERAVQCLIPSSDEYAEARAAIAKASST